MSPGWIGFACGGGLGTLAGMVIMGVCLAAKWSDRHIERMFADVVPPERYTLKMFCADEHEWFGECIPARCPRCHKPAIGARL